MPNRPYRPRQPYRWDGADNEATEFDAPGFRDGPNGMGSMLIRPQGRQHRPSFWSHRAVKVLCAVIPLLALAVAVLRVSPLWPVHADSSTTGTGSSMSGASVAPPAPQQTLPTKTGRLAGINTEPSMRTWRYNGPNPDSWWCAPPNCFQNSDPHVTITTEVSLAHQLGVSVLREEFPWPLIEPGRGVYDWSRADYIVHAVSAAGIQLQPILVFTPPWASANGSPVATPSVADWSSFVSAIAARYKGTVKYWEMWNEPNYGFNGGGYLWPGSQQDYVTNILCAGYRAAHGANSAAQVLLGGPSSPDAGWFNNIYSYGGGNCFDIMAFHDYGNPVADSFMVEGVLKAHGQGNKPIWVGEYGTQENTTSDGNQQQLMRNVMTSNSPIAVAIWYNIRDDYSMLCCGPTIHSAAFWGLVQHNDMTLKAGFSLFRQLATGSMPAPTGTGGGSTGGGTTPPTPATGGGSGGSTASSIQSVPCTVTMNGQQMTGSCSGTFSPVPPGAGQSSPPPTTQMVPPTR